LIDRGELGELFYLEADYIHDLRNQAHHSRFNAATGMNWWLQAEKPMVGGGSHPIGALSWFLNSPPVEVQACSHRMVFPEMVHDASMVAVFRFACGVIAKVTALYWCVTPYADANHLAIYGTKGTIRRQAICRDGKEGFVPLPIRWGESGKPVLAEATHMIDCILNDREPGVGYIEAAQAAAAGIMAEEAARERCAVSIPTFEEYRREGR
jgi:predicted dehydrogenase